MARPGDPDGTEGPGGTVGTEGAAGADERARRRDAVFADDPLSERPRRVADRHDDSWWAEQRPPHHDREA